MVDECSVPRVRSNTKTVEVGTLPLGGESPVFGGTGGGTQVVRWNSGGTQASHDLKPEVWERNAHFWRTNHVKPLCWSPSLQSGEDFADSAIGSLWACGSSGHHVAISSTVTGCDFPNHFESRPLEASNP